jgi:flagellin-like protein
MKYLSKNKKGVSPIIATLLLIVIAVAAAVVTYAFVTGFIGTATSQSNQQGAMVIDTASVNSSGILTYVRNTGTKSEILSVAYVDNVAQTVTFGWANATIAPNQVITAYITGSNWADSVAHQVKIVASDGTPVAASVHS